MSRYDLVTCTLTAVCTLVIGTAVARAATPVRSYNIRRAVTPITIDGRLDDGAWASATEDTLMNAYTCEPLPMTTTVRLLWDDTYLYIGVYGEDTDAWAVHENDDENLWEAEVFEFFIDPEGLGHTYYEMNITPIDRIVDLFVTNGGPARDDAYVSMRQWDFRQLEHAVHVEGDGKNEGTRDIYWSAEVAIPFADLWTAPSIPPEPWDMWRMNIFRIERGRSDVTTDDWSASFNCTDGLGFHIPRRFGMFFFVK